MAQASVSESAPATLCRPVVAPETLFGGLGLVLVLALSWRSGGNTITLLSIALLTAYLIGVKATQSDRRGRMIINYFVVLTFYAGSGAVIEALGLPLHHGQLLAWDRTLFGETPGVVWQGRVPGWINDLLSGGYLSYHVYLHWVIAAALWRSDAWRAAYSRVVFSAFGVGFIGYFLFPAGDPRAAFPELFHAPIEGGWMTRFNHWIVGNFAARYCNPVSC